MTALSRQPMYAFHNPGEIISRASGYVYDLTEAEKTVHGHIKQAIEHPEESTALVHGKLALDMARAIRQARVSQ